MRHCTVNYIILSAAAAAWNILICTAAAAEVTAIKPDPSRVPVVSAPASNDPRQEKKKSSTARTVRNFKGIGNKYGTTDSGFDKKDGIPEKVDLNKRKREGITLSPGMQRFADGAGRTLKQIDKKVLDVVEEPFKWLGLEAESAKIRPMHSGVGLGVSINLDKRKKNAKAEAASAKSDSQEFYDLIKPHESSHTMKQ